MRSGWLLAVLVLLLACKKYEDPKKIGEACTDTKQCEEPLKCSKGLKATAVCVKACGPSKADEITQKREGSDYVAPDYTCPQGWECSAILESRYRNTETGEEGKSFGGMHDQAICVPTGWKPAAEPAK